MGQNLRLLLMEDDSKAAALLCNRFRAEGAAVEHAANGAAGLEAARQGVFDVLVVDRMMPQMSGTEVVGSTRPESGFSCSASPPRDSLHTRPPPPPPPPPCLRPRLAFRVARLAAPVPEASSQGEQLLRQSPLA